MYLLARLIDLGLNDQIIFKFFLCESTSSSMLYCIIIKLLFQSK